MEEAWAEWGLRLEALRKAAKVSRFDLVAEMGGGVSYSRIQRVEEGRVEIDPEFDRKFREAVARIASRRAEKATKALAGAL